MNQPIGIDAISYHVPTLYLPIQELAEVRGIEYAKLNKGLGLSEMALCDTDEDVATLAAEAALKLILDYNIDPSQIGRIYLGTESALDAAKPTAAYVMHMLEQKLAAKYGDRVFRNCDVLDMTFACIGGVDALLNSRDWVALNNDKIALVIAADVAKYELDSTGEYTQGAGAVAMTVSQNPNLLIIDSQIGVATESVSDFFKPRRTYDKRELLMQASQLLGQTISHEEAEALIASSSNNLWGEGERELEVFKEEPVFDGPFSNSCYQNRIFEALEHLKSQRPDLDVFQDWQHLVFHLPYAFQGRRMLTKQWVNWILKSDEKNDFLNEIQLPLPSTDQQEWDTFVKAASKTARYKEFVKDRIERGERASSRIGNMYTASIFMSLVSLLKSYDLEGQDLSGESIGFFSYGSGSKSKVFSATVAANWQTIMSKLEVFDDLDKRTPVSFDVYQKLHKKELTTPLIETKNMYLNKVGANGTELGYRFYTTS